MKDTINKIRLDLDKEEIRTSVSIAKGTTLGRTLYITLLNGGTPYPIPDGAIATLTAIKPDGKDVYNDCALIGDEIVYSVSNQLIAEVGDVRCQVILTLPDLTRIPSPVFLIRVYERLFDESVLESTNEYSALQTYCIRAQEAAVKAELVVATTKAAMQAVSAECAESTRILTQKVTAATLIEETTSNSIVLEKEKNIALVTNIHGYTSYPEMAEPEAPCEAVSLGTAGTISLVMSDSPEFEWVDDSIKIAGFKEPLRSVQGYHDELCYLNSELYVKRVIKEVTLSDDNEWAEIDLFSDTGFAGKLHAYATPLADAIRNPKGVWYTTSHFRYEITDINAVPLYGVAFQRMPGYVVLVTDKEYDLFIDWLGTRNINVLYVAEQPTIGEVLDFNGVVRYNTASDLRIAIDCTNINGTTLGYAQLTVQKPVSQFANAVMELM